MSTTSAAPPPRGPTTPAWEIGIAGLGTISKSTAAAPAQWMSRLSACVNLVRRRPRRRATHAG
jgi:hypothetical protein